MPLEYIRRFGTNACTHVHFKFGAGQQLYKSRVTINSQYLFGHADNRLLLYLYSVSYIAKWILFVN